MTLLLTTALAVFILAVVVAVAMMGWGGGVGRFARLGLTMTAAGLLWASPGRFSGQPPGFGDLLFLAGIAVYLAAVHMPAIWRRLDACDGAQDGRITLKRRVGG